MECTITVNEEKVLRGFAVDDFVQDQGWDNPYAGAWVKGFHLDIGLSAKTFSGVMSSLSQKDLIRTNGESFTLTNDGRNILRDMLSKK